MGIVKKLLSGSNEDKKEFKIKFKQAQQELKIQRLLEERDKSSNQRVLEREIKREAEEELKEEVQKLNMRKTKEAWKGKPILKGHKSILGKDTKVLENDRPILGQKNIFLDNKTKNPINKKEMFFKW